jgi:predicted DsbA family dithiol-disulfide isomerase
MSLFSSSRYFSHVVVSQLWHLAKSVCAPRLIAFVLLIFLARVIFAQNSDRDRVVATVSGAPITLREVDAATANKIFALQQQIFALRKTSLENLILRRILENESARRSLSVDVLKRSLLDGPVDVLPSQIEELYAENVSAFASMSADEAKEKLRLDLEAHARLKRYREELAKLRQAFNVEIFLDEPRLPTPITNEAASMGNLNAQIVITEFSDFQCPYCRSVQATIKEVLRQYGDKVRLEFKHLPLEQHPLAKISAQAAFCSGKQGRFWEYHDALFGSNDLSREFLEATAKKAGLQLSLFQECLVSAESRLAIIADLHDAKRLGIDSTPTFLINGKLLRGAASLEQFKLTIDRELKTLRNGSAGQQR